MTRLAVFLGPRDSGARSAGRPSLRRRLEEAAGGGLEYEFLPAPTRGRPRLDPGRFAGALLAVGAQTSASAVRAARRALPARPVGGLAVTPDARALRRIDRLGLDFVIEAWRPSDPLPEAVLAHLQGARRPAARPGGEGAAGAQTTARRLAILTDVVKTANSILEPRKVIELVVEKIRAAHPLRGLVAPHGGRGEAGAGVRGRPRRQGA